jgi:hypothetical protein
MILINKAGNKTTRVTALLFTAFCIFFLTIILQMLELSVLLFSGLEIGLILLFLFNLYLYAYGWKIFVDKNKIELVGVIKRYTFTSTFYSVHHVGIISALTGLYKFKIQNSTFWFFYKRNPFLFGVKNIVSEIEGKISQNLH